MKKIKYIYIILLVSFLALSVPFLIKILDDEKAFYADPVTYFDVLEEKVQANYKTEYLEQSFPLHLRGFIDLQVSVREESYKEMKNKKNKELEFFSAKIIDLSDGKRINRQDIAVSGIEGEYKESFKPELDFTGVSVNLPRKSIIEVERSNGEKEFIIDPNYDFGLAVVFTTKMSKDTGFIKRSVYVDTEYILAFNIEVAGDIVYFQFKEKDALEVQYKGMTYSEMIKMQFDRMVLQFRKWLNADSNIGGDK